MGTLQRIGSVAAALLGRSSLEAEQARHTTNVEALAVARKRYQEGVGSFESFEAAEREVKKTAPLLEAAEQRQRESDTIANNERKAKVLAQLKQIVAAHTFEARRADAQPLAETITNSFRAITESIYALDQLERESKRALLDAVELELICGVELVPRDSYTTDSKPSLRTDLYIANAVRHEALDAFRKATVKDSQRWGANLYSRIAMMIGELP